VTIHGKVVVGFAMRIADLGPEDSVRLQQGGIGGRRRFGCGLFVPDPGR
jgi:CRISPR-associated protein Cas6